MDIIIIAFIFAIIGSVADLYCTKINKKGGGKEANPLFRNKDGQANLVAASIVSLLVIAAYAYAIHVGQGDYSHYFGFIYGAYRLYFGAWSNYKAPGFRIGLNK